MPALAIGTLGLMLDVMTQGPLGIWAVAGLVAGLAGRLARQANMRAGWLRASLWSIATLAAVTLVMALMTSLYALQIVAWRPIVEAFLAACLVYPVLAAMLSIIDRLWPAPAGRMLFLRGD